MAVEADFARDYGIDLPRALEDGMSWRRFAALLRGLSASSLYVYLTSRGGKPQPLRAADAADFFSSFPKAGE